MGSGAFLGWLGSVWALARYGIPALPILARLWLRRTDRQRAAERALRGLLRAQEAEPQTPPLTSLGGDVYEVDVGALCPQAPTADGPRAVTVVHLLGSGETRLSPLPGLQALIAADPGLATHRHLIADTPMEAAAFLGPEAFIERLLRNLTPHLDDGGPVVLMGLSRGALASLEIACRVGIEQQRPIAALALSPPARADYEWPRSVTNIASLEASTRAVVELGRMPGFIERFTERRMRHIFMAFSAWVMAELSFATEQTLGWVACEALQRPPAQLCLRAVREFSLLTRVPDTELRHAYSSIAERAAACPHVKLTVCWGQDDVWIPAQPAKERVDAALQRHGADADRIQTLVLAGWNHGIGRELDKDFAPLATRVRAHCEWVARQHAELTGRAPDMIEGQHDARRG